MRARSGPGGLSQCNRADTTALTCQCCSDCLCHLRASTSALTRPSLWSAIVQESMKVCAMTRSTASTLSDVCTSKTNWGFLMMLIQNRRGRLQRRWKRGSLSAKKAAAVLEDILYMLLVILVTSQLHPLGKTSFSHCALLPCTPILLLLSRHRWLSLCKGAAPTRLAVPLSGLADHRTCLSSRYGWSQDLQSRSVMPAHPTGQRSI